MFEVQQTCDITYRLYDWDRVDAKTGRPRDLHVELGLACSDFARGPCPPVTPARAGARERLVGCPYFTFDRHLGNESFLVGAAGTCRAVVCVGGGGELECGGTRTPLAVGDVVLIPASAGAAVCHPVGGVTLLECGIPTGAAR
jgi:mannose-6-phosphate isomerase